MRKRIIVMFVFSLFSFLLMGCDWFNSKPGVSTTSSTPTSSSTNSSTSEERLSTIAEVKNGTIGEIYTTRATVIGTTFNGVLVYDGNDAILVFISEALEVEVNDFVEITGTTFVYKDTVQFGTDTSITKLADRDGFTFQSTVVEGKDISTYIENIEVGDYIQLTGTVTSNGNVERLSMVGTDVKALLQGQNVTQYVEQEIKIKCFVLYYDYNLSPDLVVLVDEVELLDNQMELKVLTVNDLHGHIERNSSGKEGLSNMAYLINEIRDEDPLDDVVLIGNGDMFQGTGLSNMSFGTAVVDCMNVMGFDVMGIGNHEFDWGIDKILRYFDGDSTNGEADFPLTNANIRLKADDSLLADGVGNVYDSYTDSKSGVDIGIISYIGNVYRSISQDQVQDYYFDLEIAASVRTIASELRKNGVEVIIVNIHGGEKEYYDYSYNYQLAFLTDDEGEYLVDAVINGHTHSYQKGLISRSNGVNMPVIQAGGNGEYFGKITITVDLTAMDVTHTALDIVDVTIANSNYDPAVEAIIQEYKVKFPDEVLIKSGETIYNTGQLHNWIGNVMLATTGADIFVSNYSGVRSTGGIKQGENITAYQMYEISPFDNYVYLLEVTYEEIKGLLNYDSIFYSLKDGVTLGEGQTYTLAVISYVYFWDTFDNVRSALDINTYLIVRDMLVLDLLQKKEDGKLFIPSYDSESSIGLQTE